MFDLAWSEILLIAVVAIIFIGPKELPAALRTFGKWTAKARVMAGEFQRNVDDMVREAELEDVKKQFDEVRGLATNPTGAIEKWVDPKGEIRGALQSPEFGTTFDKPGLDKPVADAPPPAASITPPAASPAEATTPAAPAEPALAEPALAEPAQPSQSVAPPSVAPPPEGAGSPAPKPAAVTTT